VSQMRALGDVADVVAGVGFPKDMQGGQDGEIPVFKVGDISAAWLRGKSLLNDSRNYLSREDAVSLGKCVPAGATVFAKIGEALRLNRRVMLGRDALVDNNVMGLIPKREKVVPRYLYYFMQTVDLGELSRSTTVPSIRKSDVVEIEISVPSLTAQSQIVAEIEKQFSRLDEAVANLQRVKANLKRYKAAVLKAAFEGRLVETEAELARREGRSHETGEQLLQRILDDRRTKWSGRGKYKESLPVAQDGLPQLPEGWTWARLDAVAALKGGITVDSKRVDSTACEVPYLRVANVQRGSLDLAEVKTIMVAPEDVEELRLYPGDILFNEGGDRDKLGRGWIWEGQLTVCIHQNHVFRARLYLPEMAPKLVSWWGNTFGKDYFQRVGKQTTNLASINLGKLSEFPVPVAPAAEQTRLVAEIERLLSVVDEVEAEVDANLQRAKALRQATLAKAFAK
jgi:type I restriction enzyme S subunit